MDVKCTGNCSVEWMCCLHRTCLLSHPHPHPHPQTPTHTDTDTDTDTQNTHTRALTSASRTHAYHNKYARLSLTCTPRACPTMYRHALSLLNSILLGMLSGTAAFHPITIVRLLRHHHRLLSRTIRRRVQLVQHCPLPAHWRSCPLDGRFVRSFIHVMNSASSSSLLSFMHAWPLTQSLSTQ